MKTFLFTLTLTALSLPNAHATFLPAGECGPQKPVLRVTGASANSATDAVRDSAAAAARECQARCQNLPGTMTSACGVHAYRFENGLHLADVDYLCACPF